jgi:two-component system, OmpR family, phosphate regulon sensor histidine kinase PhoR
MRQLWKHIKWMPVLMTLTIVGLATFQLYWLKKAYEREARTLEIRSNITFRESIQGLQAAKLKIDRVMIDSTLPPKTKMRHMGGAPSKLRVEKGPDPRVMRVMNVLDQQVRDSLSTDRTLVLRQRLHEDSARPTKTRSRKRLMEFLYEMESPSDTLTVKDIQAAFTARMEQQSLSVPFSISRLSVPDDEREERRFNRVTVGFRNPITYELQLGNTTPYLLKRILVPVLLSLFLLAFTIGSFALLYRNLLHQRRLADIKNEFISNITHELKTPIATVSVAIEALRTFNGNIAPEKTKEYLDISANELQRLSLLVDKVLKLSMFEKREVDLKYEPLDMKELVAEVTSSMRLQFEKHHASVHVTTEGDTTLQADRLHLVSVIFNLMDNALKYKKGKPRINVHIQGGSSKVSLFIDDNGIGIPHEYHDRIFEKFFRVPTGNVHNAKGYGLGLSYVAHVVNRHKGAIRVESAEGAGCRFMISLPKHPEGV